VLWCAPKIMSVDSEEWKTPGRAWGEMEGQLSPKRSMMLKLIIPRYPCTLSSRPLGLHSIVFVVDTLRDQD